MPKGKQTCKILKEIRKQIATENDIELVVSECTYQGDCLGTCPKCEAEVRYLERELEKRQRMGKAAVFAGMSLGTLFAATSCNNSITRPLEGDVPYTPDSTELSNDTIDELYPLEGEPYVPDTTKKFNDTIPDEPILLEGDVVAPVPDSIKKGEEKKTCKGDGEALTDDKDGEGEQEIFGFVPGEELPYYPYGDEAMYKFVNENLVYPQEAIDAGVEGRVFVRFWINEDGSLSDFEVARGIGYGCDGEAVRVIQSMPKWKPGKRNHEPVKMQYMMPVIFKLQ